MTTLVWDWDYLKYSVGCIAEKRSVVVTHKQSGNQKEFKTRTAFYGHWGKKNGGWLEEQNKKRTTPWVVDDFTIEDKQVAEPAEFALGAVKRHIDSIIDKLGADRYYGYIGKGDSWRVEASTILKYKGQRADLLKPLHMETIEEYLINRHGAEVVRHLEADDQCVMDCTAHPEYILVGVDKDFMGNELTLFNPDKMTKPKKISGFGRLSIGSDKKVHGEGRIWLLHQILSGDVSDNYFANSASDIKWGEKSSYSVLNACTNDKDALQAVVNAYKELYPASKTITGWRGNEFKVDWLYVLQENFTMARMLKHENDFINVKDTLNKLGVKQ